MIGPAPLRKRMGVKQSETLRSASHKAWIRRQLCVCARTSHSPCNGPVQAAHFRGAGGGGLGLKNGDQWCFPACHKHHSIQHGMGENAFQLAYGLDLHVICRRLARQSPDQRIREKAT